MLSIAAQQATGKNKCCQVQPKSKEIGYYKSYTSIL